ncbi:MAG: ABC transporter transmembrane domain-containing protein, partial [Elusimicrobiota bacterium]
MSSRAALTGAAEAGPYADPGSTRGMKVKPSAALRIWGLLTPAERRGAVALLGLMFVGMLLETLGVGLVIPAIALLTRSDLAHSYPVLQPALQALGGSDQRTLVIWGMLVLVGVYFVKGLFLAFLAWRQMGFAFGVQAQVSQSLFTIYLRQPYPFHLQRNSANLIRNVISEVNMLTFNVMLPGMSLLGECLVLLGLCALLLFVEPVGALIVMGVLGAASWGFHHLTRMRIARWGEARLYHEGLRIQHLQQGLGGAKEVKLLGREADFLEQYRVHNVQSASMGRSQSILQQLPRLWRELLAGGGLAILVVSVLGQGRPLEAVLPALGVFAAAAFRLIPSVTRVISAMQSLRYGLPVIDVLCAEFKLAVPEATGARTPVRPFRTALELSGVTYTYPGAPGPALNDVSIAVRCGESV